MVSGQVSHDEKRLPRQQQIELAEQRGIAENASIETIKQDSWHEIEIFTAEFTKDPGTNLRLCRLRLADGSRDRSRLLIRFRRSAVDSAQDSERT
jgi:hypothetical protein